MTITCQNCAQHFKGNYCNHCGQPAATHRINAHFFWHDIQHSLLHIDKGILYTIKELFTRPGNSIREFMQGKRHKHFRPISLVLVLAGLCGFLYHYYHINMFAGNVSFTSDNAQSAAQLQTKFNEAADWTAEHNALISLLELPIYAFATFLAFKNRGYNFIEHIILNAFLTAQRFVLHLVAFPLYYIYNGTHTLSIIERCVNIIGFILMVVSLMGFFNRHKKWHTLLRSLLSLVIFGVLISVIVIIVVNIISAKFG